MLTARKMEDMAQTSFAQNKEGNFDLLGILHHLSSGLKAYVTDYAYIAIDELRQACGGAGYHIASGVATNSLNTAALLIADGVSVVMIQ